MKLDLEAPGIADWLRQFDAADQLIAAELLQSILVVGADELSKQLTQLIRQFAAKNLGPIALYTERHIRRFKGKPNRLFKETDTKTRRAIGRGPPPVPAGHSYSRDTGSEGVIATLISQLVRAEPTRFLDHPGPDDFRKFRIRHYLIVTDFVGSGRRARDNIEAAWQLRSFKSWHSYKLLKFAVIAFSGTARGVQAVEQHASFPTVHLHVGCPIIHDLPYKQRDRISSLCIRYGPQVRHSTVDRTPLGYDDGGALITFDHGMPNNAPLLLHTKTKTWIPLFPRRSGALLRNARTSVARPAEIERRLTRLRESRLSRSARISGMPDNEQDRILVLSALKRNPRTPIVLSSRTGVPIIVVETLIAQAQRDGLVNTRQQLTQRAYDTLEYLRRTDRPIAPLPKTNESLYCPQMLRSPRKVV